MSLDLPGTLEVAADPAAVAGAAAGWIAACCAGRDRFSIALSGGSTPRGLFEALTGAPFVDSVDWSAWHVFFSDERAVPADDGQSNYRLAREHLLARVPVPAAQVHRMEAERPDLDAAAADYASILTGALGDPPRLDLVLLGLGEDGHTASLFPGSAALDAVSTWVTRGHAPQPPHERMTLTLPTINAATRVAFLVTGAAKATALRGVVAGTVPAALVRPPDGAVSWFLDEAAAEALR